MPPVINVPKLNNKELADLLKEYGFSTGPIVGSTRKIYEKKLIQCMTGEEIKSYHAPAPHDDSEDDDVPPSPAYQERSEPRRRVLRSDTPEKVNPFNEFPRRSPKVTPTKTATTEPNTESSTAKSGIPLWVKLIFLVIMIVTAYLVVKNMESSEDNNIPRGIEAEV